MEKIDKGSKLREDNKKSIKCEFCDKKVGKIVNYKLHNEENHIFCSDPCFQKWLIIKFDKLKLLLRKFKEGTIKEEDMVKYIVKNPILSLEIDVQEWMKRL